MTACIAIGHVLRGILQAAQAATGSQTVQARLPCACSRCRSCRPPCLLQLLCCGRQRVKMQRSLLWTQLLVEELPVEQHARPLEASQHIGRGANSKLLTMQPSG